MTDARPRPEPPVSSAAISRLVCFFRNHRATPDYDALVWRCERCGAAGPKLWMTGAWFAGWLRREVKRFDVFGGWS